MLNVDQALVSHNIMVAKSSDLFPAVRPTQMSFGTLAGSHLNITLRLFQIGGVSPVTGLSFAVCDDKHLDFAVSEGHLWIVLDEAITEQEAMATADYKNSEQNQSQVRHEIELIKAIQKVCLAEEKLSRTVQTSRILEVLQATSPVKLVVDQAPHNTDTFAQALSRIGKFT